MPASTRVEETPRFSTTRDEARRNASGGRVAHDMANALKCVEGAALHVVATRAPKDLGRAEAFAMKNKPVASFMDGVGNGLGYSFILMSVAVVRELFGSGKLFGIEILPLVTDGGWYIPNGLLLLPPSAFFIIGMLIWGVRTWKPAQAEKPDYQIHVVHRTESV